MSAYIEPLDSALWFQRIEMIASGKFDLESSLRHACHLLQLAPRALRHVVRLAIEEDRFEALLEAGEFDTAARHLVAQPTAIALKREQEGRFVRASLSCAILNRVLEGTGESEATAILDAWTSCLLAVRDAFGAGLAGYPFQEGPEVRETGGVAEPFSRDIRGSRRAF